MRETLSWSASETIKLLPSLRFVLGSLDVRMWRILVWWRLILPLPVLEKRLAAPVWVFNLGIVFSISAGQVSKPAQNPSDHFRTTLGTGIPCTQSGPTQYIAAWNLLPS